MRRTHSAVKSVPQTLDGNRMARELDWMVRCAHLSLEVEVVSCPDRDPYRIKVIKLDPSGEPLYKGSDRKGFVFFQVEIKHPDKFSFWTLGERGKRDVKEFHSSAELEEEAKRVLLDKLCTFWVNSEKSRE